MKLTLSTHTHKGLLGFGLSLLCILFFSCHTKPPIIRRSVKVVLAGTPSYLCNELGKLTDDGRSMFDELESDNDKCKYTYILDPTLLRLDLGTEYSIITKIERSGVSASDNPNRVVKLVKQNLEDLRVSENFLQKVSKRVNVDSLYIGYMSSITNKDSVLVFVENSKSDSITISSLRYKVMTNVVDVRNRLLSIMCQNDKANLVLLINPPTSIPPTSSLTLKLTEPNCQTGELFITTLGGDGTPVTFKAEGLSTGPKSGEFVIPKNQLSGKTFAFFATQSGITTEIKYTTKCPILPPPEGAKRGENKKIDTDGGAGIVSIIKGSEGCDLCTRYYSGVDHLGLTREFREKNSTNCCPCGKTVQVNGRSYRMDCSDEGNKLTLVD